MNSLAAIRTVTRPQPGVRQPERLCWFVEDLNWPGPRPGPGKKLPPPTELWAPGPDGQWEGVTPTLQ